VKVRLRCTLSAGQGKDTPPGSIVNMDRSEALRLIKMKLVEPFDVGKEVDTLVPDDGTDGDGPAVTFEEAKKELLQIKGIDESLAAGLFDEKIFTIADIASMKSIDTLVSFDGVSRRQAKDIIASAKILIGN